MVIIAAFDFMVPASHRISDKMLKPSTQHSAAATNSLIVHCGTQVKNVAAASNAALQHDVAFLQKETQELQSKLEESLQSFDTVQQDARAVEGEVVDEVTSVSSSTFLLILITMSLCPSTRQCFA